MALIYLIIGGLICFVGYHVAVLVFHAVKIGIKQANDLERQFGPDVVGAAKYTLLGKK
jgi:hypothetical protein